MKDKINKSIKIINASSEEFEYVKSIRTEVFTDELQADASGEFDEYDSPDGGTKYFLLYDSEKAVATARLAHTDCGMKLGRVAVLGQYRGRGYGALIVKAVLEYAFAHSASFVLVDAREEAVKFYENIGFKIIGKRIYDRGLPHMPMKLNKGEFVDE